MNNKGKGKEYFGETVSNGNGDGDSYNGKMLKRAYDKLPHGTVKLAAIQSAIQQADRHKDVYYQMTFRYDFGYEAHFYDDEAKTLPCCMELISLYDQNPQVNFPEGYPLMLLQWTIHTCANLPQIPIAQVEGLLEEYRKRCAHFGVTLRTYYWEACRFYVAIDVKKALEFFDLFCSEPRDYFSDCEACEQRNMTWIYLKFLDDFEKAWELAKPMFSGDLTCHGVPLGTYDMFMCWYLEHDDLENAKKMGEELYVLVKNKKQFLSCIGNLLWLYSRTDLEKGVSVFEKHLKFAIDLRGEDTLFDFYRGMWAFFREFGRSGRAQIKLILPEKFEAYQADGVYTVNALSEYAYHCATKLAQRFDLRNGTDFYAKELALAE